MYYTYMIRCEGGILYTGIAKDLFSRMAQHAGIKKGAAKFTKSHALLSLEALWSSADRSTASRLEWAIKQLKKAEKEKLIASPRAFADLLPALEKEDYVRHDMAVLDLYLKKIKLPDLLSDRGKGRAAHCE